MVTKNILFQIALLILCFVLFSTTVFADNSSGQENYFEVNYNNFSGLTTSESNDILQTSDGYIWIASYSNLIRYDGKEFVTYFESHGLTSIICLFVDSKDRLWIGTNNDGVVLYENNTFNFITTGQDIPSFSARSITETADGDILVGTALGIFKIEENLNFEMLDDSRLENAFVMSLEKFGDNQTFGLTKTGELFILEGTEVVDFISIDEWNYDVPLSVLPLVDDMGDYFLIGTNSNYMVKLRKKIMVVFLTKKFLPTI